mmetsp:Transcript_31047/g.79842  ORF Transcript_31047/g.79842 Transcript_31047/m.79842 type:complete len:346 (+) Transcript_31047:67-1104(+)
MARIGSSRTALEVCLRLAAPAVIAANMLMPDVHSQALAFTPVFDVPLQGAVGTAATTRASSLLRAGRLRRAASAGARSVEVQTTALVARILGALGLCAVVRCDAARRASHHAGRRRSARVSTASRGRSRPLVARGAGVEEDVPRPDVPGLDDMNQVVHVVTEPKSTEVSMSHTEGADMLMQQSCGTILGLMAQDGWEVNCLDEAAGLFEVFLPSVKYPFPMGSISIPQPRFLATVRDSIGDDGEYHERLIGDLVLQNGKDILKFQPKLWGPTFAISAAGWARCRVGREGGAVRMVADVELGMKVPKVPGLSRIMEFFVKNYANQSTKDCTVALAKGADIMVENKK